MTEPSVKNVPYLHRIQSIDVLRGLILIIMTLDHVRDYFAPELFDPLDLSQTHPFLFFTRWITHFCAPTFVLLTGISAYLYGAKKTKSALSGFLLKRGLWLIFLELVVVTFFWKFSFAPYVVFQVIWALGASMVILSLLVWLPIQVILMLSLVIIFGHNALDHIALAPHTFWSEVWPFLHTTPSSHAFFKIIYPLIPWPGVMAFGYCLGGWFQQPVEIRNKRFVLLGISCLILFVVLRYFTGYGDPHGWRLQEQGTFYTFLSFINVTKYPVSLLFLLVVLGLVFLCWPLFEKWHGSTSRFLLCYGKVSLFYYLLHIPIIHVAAVLYYFFNYREGWFWRITPWNSIPWPTHAYLNLSVIYTAWALIVLLMYPLCAGYKRYKSTHNYGWLSYL